MPVIDNYKHLKLMPFQWEPFNGDHILALHIKAFAHANHIEEVIELGTCLGSSTLWFARNFKEVSTCEINPEFAKIADERFTEAGVSINLYPEDSRSCLDWMLPSSGKVLIFIDSHWGPHNPLTQELAIIARKGNKEVYLVIHDFKTDNPTLQYDTYPAEGIVYELAWIKKSLDDIYGQGRWEYFYNTEAAGAKVGAIFIHPA